MAYRTYDAQWNHTGYASERQYSGQADIPPCSTCSEPAERLTGLFHVRRCANGHLSGLDATAEILAAL